MAIWWPVRTRTSASCWTPSTRHGEKRLDTWWTRRPRKMRPDERVHKQGNPAVAGSLCLTGATGLEPATSGVTGDPAGFRLDADTDEVPAQDRFSSGCPDERKQASEGG